MRGKILKIEIELPETVRYIQENYKELATRIRIQGGNPYSISELSELFEDLSIVRIVTKKGNIVYYYEDEVIRFDFYSGFAYNTASVPSIFKPIIDNDEFKMMVASFPHDGLYTGHQMSKKDTDSLFVDTIEYFHDSDKTDGFFENLGEEIIEKGIAFAFTTDEAQKSWDMGEDLAIRSRAMMKVTRTEV